MNQPFVGSNNAVEAMKNRRCQSGVTLLETLIAMVLGLMVMAGILQFVSRLVEANTTTLKTTRLEQDVRTLMDMMVQDIRPAGQFPGAASDLGIPAKFIADQPAAPTIDGKALHTGQRGSSLSYAYQESDGKVVKGSFSHDAKTGTIQMHTGTASAPETISDPAFMSVTTLEFLVDSAQIQAGSLGVSLPSVQIRIVSQLKSDPTVERVLIDRVTWRNPVVVP
jgi:prepilin peptidase dependent protein B